MHKRFLMILAMVSIACSTIFGFGSSERNAAISNSNENTIFLTENPNFVVSLYSDGEKTNFSSGAYKYNPNQKYNIECSSVSEKNIIKEISFFSTKDYSPVISPIIVNKSTYSGEIQFPATKEGITIHISSDIRQFNITCRSNAGMWRYDGKPIKNNSIINITPGDNKTLSLEFDEEVYYVKSKPFEADIINGKQVEISTRNISSNGIIEVLLGQYIHIDVPTEKQLVLYKNSNYTRRIERSDKFKPGDTIYAEISDLDYFLNEVPGCKIVENPSNNAKTRRYTIQIGEITGLIRFSISKGTTVEYDSDIDDLFYVDLTIDNEIIKKGKLECRIGAHYSLSIQPRLELDDDIVLRLKLGDEVQYFPAEEYLYVEGIIRPNYKISISVANDVYYVRYPQSKIGGSFSIIDSLESYTSVIPGFYESSRITDFFNDNGKITLLGFPSAGFYTNLSPLTGKKNDNFAGSWSYTLTVKDYVEKLDSNSLPEFRKFSTYILPDSTNICRFEFEFNGERCISGQVIEFIPGEKLKVKGTLYGGYTFGFIAGKEKTETFELPVTDSEIRQKFEYRRK